MGIRFCSLQLASELVKKEIFFVPVFFLFATLYHKKRNKEKKKKNQHLRKKKKSKIKNNKLVSFIFYSLFFMVFHQTENLKKFDHFVVILWKILLARKTKKCFLHTSEK
jgi:Na+/H+ antiporter NhaD/arsenite permease-like protein